MRKSLFFFVVFSFPFFANAQTKKQPVKKLIAKQQPTKKKAYDGMLRTNNADTLYFEIDNAIIITPKGDSKKECYFKATSGEIFKLSNNFYQLGNIKDSSVTITVFDKATNTLLETKKFVVAKQVLPF